MTYTVLGIFTDQDDAEDAINHLEDDGYNPKDISIIMKDEDAGQQLATNTGTNVTGGAVTGATTGAVVGGLAGLLIGIGAIAIPGIGAILVGGPLAAALGLTGAAATTASGAATGALAGGLLGALMGLGVPEETAKVYEEGVREGGILVAVPVSEDRVNEVEEIMTEFDAQNIQSVSAEKERSHVTRHSHTDESRRHTTGHHRVRV